MKLNYQCRGAAPRDCQENFAENPGEWGQKDSYWELALGVRSPDSQMDSRPAEIIAYPTPGATHLSLLIFYFIWFCI